MEDKKDALISKTISMLLDNGFSVADTRGQFSASFDIIARRDIERYVLKVLYNIDTLKPTTAYELAKVAKFLRSTATIVGEKTGGGLLEDGVIYYRHGIPISSLETFRNYINGERPYIYSGPGGFYVKINGEALREMRMKMSLSIGYLSHYLGVSRRSVSLYESGSSATIDIFLKLQEIIKGDLVDHQDLFKILPEELPEERVQDIYVQMLLDILERIGLDTRPAYRMPFDVLARDEDVISLIASILSEDTESTKIQLMKRISDVLEEDAFLISKRSTTRENINGCPVVNLVDLERITGKDELLRMLEKRAR
ncbi:transcriptional regulator [Thermoplasma sp. Kam2015]|uniref:transcriptional regulator n=1 Tax=Thermoplasma sp. Kam2015 TaxID=2094122 RepID=UPI000D937A5D|nr:transcriptional regulator [Thermoplasma sp. Kam2015]PYB67668.1 transcriptional regulator [Thermoplasma sp. Kam2015]